MYALFILFINTQEYLLSLFSTHSRLYLFSVLLNLYLMSIYDYQILLICKLYIHICRSYCNMCQFDT